MANSNNSELSSQDLVESTGALSDLSTEWNRKIFDINLGSIDIRGAFSALTGQGVAVQYVESLENAIKKIEQNAISISSIISKTASEQTEADERSAAESRSKPFNSYISGGSGGGYSGVVAGSVSYSGNGKPDVGINPGNETEKKELTDEEEVKTVDAFKKIFDGNIYEVLFDKNFASHVKEKLLESPNISKEIKDVLLEMDQNEIQVMLRNIFLSGEEISDFSKTVVTIFNKSLKAKNINIYDLAENISKTYSKLATSDDIQGLLRELYNGTSSIENVDDNTIYFTRDLVDFLADTSKITSEELLTNSSYKNDLELGVKDLSNTFAILRGAKDCDSKISSNLYSNIIV